MTLFHFFNCAILTFGPHAVYYSATPLSEYDTLGTSIKVAVAYLVTAIVKLTHRNISQNHKFQAVGLGWAFADSVLHRLAPLWVGARGLEFTWDYILQGLEANANILGNLDELKRKEDAIAQAPDFNIKLSDRTTSQRLKVHNRITSADQDPEAMMATLHHRNALHQNSD
ncbi:hypothetical protein K1719_024319 [Acacia pycnantha]|nr:hypothetical protein K1719_024319 [Acacia pycnantha]